MGVRKCIIAGCPSTSDRKEDRGVSYHKIPANEEQKQRWWVACRLPDNYVINKGSNLCSRHFRKADFQAFKGTKYLLKNGVVPTIFPWSAPAAAGGGGGGRKKKDEEKKKKEVTAAAAAEVVKVEEKKEVVIKKEKEEEQGESSKVEPEVVVKEEGTAVMEEVKKEGEVQEPVKPEEKKEEVTPKEEPVSTPVAVSKNKTSAKKRSTPKRPAKTPTSAPSSKKTRRSEPSAPTATPKDRKSVQSPRKLNQSQINFIPGTKIEAQDFSGKWHPAKLGEVDTEEGEVLVQFEKSGGKSKSAALNDEWIPMDSVRLRPFQAQPKTPTGRSRFVVGEKCFARWSDSRKFRATIQAVLENEMYEVLFDDGFVKVCRANHVSKLKKPDGTMDTEQVEAAPEMPVIKQEPMDDSVATDTSLLSPGPAAVAPGTPIAALYIPQITKVSEYPEIPQSGEWFCPWMNDFPVGDEAILEVGTSKLNTVIVADWRLPEGWVKHVYQRFTAFGKMDIILVNSEGKQFRSRQEVKTYLAEKGLEYDANVYDFGLHKRRAKDLGYCRYTQEYKDAFLPPPVPAEPVLLNTEVNIGSVKVKIIDNLFQCPEVDCLKTFRKENHLQIHIKHYHKELAKGLGEIPNMQDLAALRTPQVELVETPPKPSPRRSQASQSGSKTSVKSEDVKKELAGDDEEKKLERDPNASEVDLKKSTTDLDPKKSDCSTDIKSPKPEASIASTEGAAAAPIATTSGFDPEEAIESHAVTKQLPTAVASTSSTPAAAVASTSASGASVKSNAAPKIKLFSKKKKKKGAKKTKGRFVSKRAGAPASKRGKKKKKVASAGGRTAAMDYMDAVAEETRHSFANESFFRHGYGFDPEASQTMTTNASICGQYGDDSINAAVNSPRFISENGEMIKIVSMKKEEIINCLCGYGEEDGLMVQCELCLCWQHGICNGFERDTQVPDKYVCYICRNPVGGRESRRYIHDQDWLYEGKLPVANYHATNAQKNAARFDILKQSHTLGGNLLELKRFMHSLKVKINIAERKDHPKMYLWSKKWEKSPPRGGNGDLSGIVPLNASITGANAPSAAAQGATSTGQSNRGDQRPVPIPHIPVPEAAIDPAECQAILLEHIQKQQNAAMARLQAIEAQIIALEAYDDKSELLESPTAKNYPKTKQTIHMLLNDLTKMKKIAAIHRSAQQPPPY